MDTKNKKLKKKKKKKPILHIYFFFPIFLKVTHFSFIVEHPFILKKNKVVHYMGGRTINCKKMYILIYFVL